MSDAHWSRTAEAYLKSAVHAGGADLLALAEIVRVLRPRVALDVGTNVGHTLRAIAPHAAVAIGSDVASAALRLNRASTSARNVAFVEADAGALPFAGGSVDVVSCRLAAHHFPDRARAFREFARVLRSGGTLLVADNYAPDDASLDRFINELELVRDRTHQREETIDGWMDLARRAGLEAAVAGTWTATIEVEEWLARSQTPAPAADAARRMLRGATAAARDAFAIGDGSFRLLKVLIRASRP